MQTKASSTWRKLFRGSNASTITIFAIFVLMCALLYAIKPAFGDMTNLMNVARAFSAYAIAGIGVSMVIMIGGIDISIGSIYGLAGVVSALLITAAGVPTIWAMLIGFLVGATCGLTNGLLVVYCKLPPYIATLGTQMIFRGICYILTRGYPISGLGKDYLWLGQSYLLRIPMAVYAMVIIIALFALFRNKMTTGRRIFAMGGNEEATRISGVNTSRLKILCFILSGITAGFAGIMNASKLGVSQPTAGNGFEMDAIASVVIGGATLSGGEGTVVGTVIGAAIIGVLRNMLVLLSVDPYFQTLIIGTVIIVAVSIDQIRKSRS
ncbi:MAG: ABC transporter permease [Clostridiales bacterium]|jgi:ribose transport system permease protein|nr:ABC transporter permease [Clostridiales bacterium]